MTTAKTYRWIIVAAGALLGCVAMGAMFALPVFLAPMTKATGWSHTGISGAMTIAFLAMAVGSVVWGTVSDRIGARTVVLVGSLLLVSGVCAAALSPSLILFQLSFGLIIGLGTAAIFAPIMATVTGWFDEHRSLAVSLVSAGIGIAPLTMSPLAAWLVTHYDWRTAYLVIAAILAVVMLPVSFLIRRPAPGNTPSVAAPPSEAMSIAEALKSPQLIILLLTNFFCCATHSGPIIHTVSYALTCGIAPMVAVSIYSVEGLAGLFGRIGFGLLGDRLGARRVLVGGLLLQAFVALAYYFTHSLWSFYLVASLFGFTYAGTMPLYAVIARENFPQRMMGTIIGGSAMAGSLGMATGPVLGGLIYDMTGSYGGLYLASFGTGLGAVMIALTFRPRRPQSGDGKNSEASA